MRILEYGEPVLRKKARAVRKITKRHKELAEEMMETVKEAPALGLAAPQVGVSERIIVARVEDKDYILVNPRIVHRSGSQVDVEGCLSLPGLQGEVRRFEKVVVRALNLRGEPVQVEATGLLSRVLQHEIDHLNGILFIDRVLPETLHWVIEDEEAEEGYRLEPTTLEEAIAFFERRRKARQGEEGKP